MFGKEVEALRKKINILNFLKIFLFIYTNGLGKVVEK